MLYTLSPLVALLFGQKVRWRCLPLWCLAAVLAASQEQSCALTLTFFLLLLAALWMREKHFRPIFLLQLLILAAETAWVLLSPGGSARTAAEAAAAYPNFHSFRSYKSCAADWRTSWRTNFSISN